MQNIIYPYKQSPANTREQKNTVNKSPIIDSRPAHRISRVRGDRPTRYWVIERCTVLMCLWVLRFPNYLLQVNYVFLSWEFTGLKCWLRSCSAWEILKLNVHNNCMLLIWNFYASFRWAPQWTLRFFFVPI